MIIESERDRPFRLLLGGSVFLLLAFFVLRGNNLLFLADDLTIQLVLHYQTGLTTTVFQVVTFLASPTMAIAWMVLLAFLLWGFKYKIPALWVLGLIVGGDALAFFVKHLVGRVRPVNHLAADDGFSFPSGHVFGTFLVIAAIWLLVLPMIRQYWCQVVLRALLMIWLILVVISRVYLGAHFPSDTLGAMLLGYLWLEIAEYLYIGLAPRLKKWRFVQNSII